MYLGRVMSIDITIMFIDITIMSIDITIDITITSKARQSSRVVHNYKLVKSPFYPCNYIWVKSLLPL